MFVFDHNQVQVKSFIKIFKLLTDIVLLQIYYEKTSNIYNCFFNLAIILNSSIRKTLYQIMNLLLLFITNILLTVFYKIQVEMTDMMNIQRNFRIIFTSTTLIFLHNYRLLTTSQKLITEIRVISILLFSAVLHLNH